MKDVPPYKPDPEVVARLRSEWERKREWRNMKLGEKYENWLFYLKVTGTFD